MSHSIPLCIFISLNIPNKLSSRAYPNVFYVIVNVRQDQWKQYAVVKIRPSQKTMNVLTCAKYSQKQTNKETNKCMAIVCIQMLWSVLMSPASDTKWFSPAVV